MNQPAISAARIFLSKNIPFGVYRFPDEDEFHLAIPEELLPHPVHLTFWMAPFTAESSARNVKLCVVRNEFLNEDLLSEYQKLASQTEPEVTLPPHTSRETYFERIAHMLQDIRSGRPQKAVLSRVIHTAKPAEFDAVHTFLMLARDYPATFVHLSLHHISGLWMGATPELLLKKRGAELFTMALAGTQLRKENGTAYRWRPKEMEEHEMVWAHVEAAFGKNNCSLTERKGPRTIEAGRVAHLETDYRFHQREAVDVVALLNDLHPTPAIGGLPAREGVASILKHEGYDRRYYCGFIGHTDFADEADFYINLRCMQVGRNEIAIYVGGGITAASDPEEEWQETVIKSRTMLDTLYPVKESH